MRHFPSAWLRQSHANLHGQIYMHSCNFSHRELPDVLRCRPIGRDAPDGIATESAAFFRLMLFGSDFVVPDTRKPEEWGEVLRGTASTHQPAAGKFTETRWRAWHQQRRRGANRPESGCSRRDEHRRHSTCCGSDGKFFYTPSPLGDIWPRTRGTSGLSVEDQNPKGRRLTWLVRAYLTTTPTLFRYPH